MGLKRYGKDVHGKARSCRCPRCHKTHTMRVLYIGPAEFPPYFCPYCKELIERCQYEVPDCHHEASMALGGI